MGFIEQFRRFDVGQVFEGVTCRLFSEIFMLVRYMIFRLTFFFLLLSPSLTIAGELRPSALAHWVWLTDGSLLVGRIESIDAELLRFDLRLEPPTTLSIPRHHVALLVVVPPVDPAMTDRLLALHKTGKAETIRLVGGEVLSGRLRSFSKGVFRFDLALGGHDGPFLESQPIPWRRIRSIVMASAGKEQTGPITIFLKNGSKIFCERCENRGNGMVLIKNSCFLEADLPLSSLNSSSPDQD